MEEANVYGESRPRQKLCEIIARYGHSVCEEPRRCEGLLRDFCGGYRMEIHVLVSALKDRIAADLLSASDGIPGEVLLARLAKRLEENLGLEKEVARWAVESWGLALGKLSSTDLQRDRSRKGASVSVSRPDEKPTAGRGSTGKASETRTGGGDGHLGGEDLRLPQAKSGEATANVEDRPKSQVTDKARGKAKKILAIAIIGMVLAPLIWGVIGSVIPSSSNRDEPGTGTVRAAENGDAKAQFELGKMYEEGRGALQSDAEAVKWYRRAAEQGEAHAQNNLGFMYEEGRGVPRSDMLAVQWYRRAAEQGEAVSQYNLGVAYEYGRGVPRDLAQAQRWYNRATASSTSQKLREDASRARDRVALQIGVQGKPATPEDPAVRMLAEHLRRSGAKFYGAFWCEHCTEQKDIFGASAQRLPYIECSPSGSKGPQAEKCQDAGIRAYPSWIIGGKRYEGTLSLRALAEHSRFGAQRKRGQA